MKIPQFTPPTRPIDPNAERVHLPVWFDTWQEVLEFYLQNNRALSWAQTDELVRKYERLRNPPKKQGANRP